MSHDETGAALSRNVGPHPLQEDTHTKTGLRQELKMHSRPREPGSRCGDSQGDEVAKNPVLRGARGMEEERDGDHAEVDGCHRRGRTCKLSSRHEVVSTTADAGGFFQPRGTEGAPMGFDMPIR